MNNRVLFALVSALVIVAFLLSACGAAQGPTQQVSAPAFTPARPSAPTAASSPVAAPAPSPLVATAPEDNSPTPPSAPATATAPIISPSGKDGPPPYPRPEIQQTPTAGPESAQTAPGTQTPAVSPTPAGTPTPVAKRLIGPAGVPRSAPFAPSAAILDEQLEKKVRDFLGADVDNYGIVVKRLTDGRGIAINADKEFYAASLFKVLVMYEVYKQRALGLLKFDSTLQITPPYIAYQLGDQRWPLWADVPIRDLVEAMITESDNLAAILLQDKTGGFNIIADFKAIGLTHTNLDGENMPTSAGDMALWMEMIARGKAVDDQTSGEMIDLLSRQKIDNGLRTLLPKGIVVAHKTGNWDNVTHDIGVIYAPSGAYVITVLSNKAWKPEPIAQVSKLVFDHFEGVGPTPTATPR
jgi:beta-lactamase class A